ncbi:MULTISPECIES: hypothetical protein [unclassified Ensifer]|uniref:hypothetical protein n=1 Tax=unclassified Ensifer TaxID=2633371 RepID=UPI00137483DB|nr:MULTISPECIES: hypothetical protein [unclassified Ensifer]
MFTRENLLNAQSISLSDLVDLGVPASSVAELMAEFEVEQVFPYSRRFDDGLIEI